MKERPEHPPVVCAGLERNAMRLSALDAVAEDFGLKAGQGVAEARAICPVLDVVAADVVADRRLLEALADWCDRYTPLVAIDDDDGLMLDITGCAHLFGGEEALIRDMVRRLLELGLEARAAVSSTPGLSWAVTRYGGPRMVPSGEEQAVLASMTVRALRISRETAALLVRVGLRTVGDLLSAPRAPLARRFGQELMLRLDRALGREGEPISPRRPLAMLSVERQLAEPISDEERIIDLAGRLAAGLRAGLEARGEGGRLFELLLFRVDGRVFRIEVGTAAPIRRPERIRSLFTERLQALRDDLDAGFGFEMIRLNILRSEAVREGQDSLDERDDGAELLSAFFDQAAARLGSGCLHVPMAMPSHWPERASLMVPVLEGMTADERLPAAQLRGMRPIRLFPHPEPVEVTAEVPDGPPASFRWRRARHRVTRAEGPERLNAEWWIDGEDASPRDYFRIEDTRGRRFWLYRQGLYERGTAKPAWFMQGIFA